MTRQHSRAWFGLLVILCPVFLVSMDGSILFLAMPRISQALTPTADQALWILDVYGFAVGSLLIAFGNIGDRYGRLKLLMIGAAVFGAGSAGAAFAPNPELLIAFRALMGLAGATLLPSALAVLSELFPDARLRARAIGIFAAAFAAGFAIGPVVGGVLLERFPWGSVFLVNLPVIAVFLALAPILLREVRATGKGRVDMLSVVLSAAGLLLAIYGIKHAAADGLSVTAVSAAIAGAGLLVWFARRQRGLEYPLIDFALFRDRVFTIAIVTGLVPLAAWSASAYLSGILLQSVLGLPVLHAALLALPGAAVLTLTCVVTPAAGRPDRRTRGTDRLPFLHRRRAGAAADDRCHGRGGLVRRFDGGRRCRLRHLVQRGGGHGRRRGARRARGSGGRDRGNEQRDRQRPGDRAHGLARRAGVPPGRTGPRADTRRNPRYRARERS